MMIVITKREKALMFAAADNTFWMMLNKLELKEVPKINIEQELQEWLDTTIADNGGTVEQYLDFMNKDG